MKSVRLLVAALAVVSLAGCLSVPYGYRDGQGGYYYSQGQRVRPYGGYVYPGGVYGGVSYGVYEQYGYGQYGYGSYGYSPYGQGSYGYGYPYGHIPQPVVRRHRPRPHPHDQPPQAQSPQPNVPPAYAPPPETVVRPPMQMDAPAPPQFERQREQAMERMQNRSEAKRDVETP